MRSLRIPFLVVAFALSGFVVSQADACTGVLFGSGDKVTVAQNVGWFWPLNWALVVNKRNVSKHGLQDSDSDVPYQWVSKYGSVALTPAGREFPLNGVNEKGLTVQGLHSYDGAYETTSGLPTLTMFQWVQYQLDLSATVAEAIENAKKVRPLGNPKLVLHYMICDASGECATFEWLRGIMHIHSGRGLPIKAFTNSDYKKSVQVYQSCASSDCPLPEDGPNFSLKRYVQAVRLATAYNNQDDPTTYAFNLLGVVKQPQPLAAWSLVMRDGVMSLSLPGEAGVQYVNLKDYDFSCKTSVEMQLMDPSHAGNIHGSFKPYDPAIQAKMAESMQATPKRVQEIKELPGKTVCLEP